MKKSLKKVLAIALVVMLLCGIAPMQNIADFFSLRASAEDEPALAASGQCGDNAYWSYVSADRNVNISGTGNMYNYSIANPSPFSNISSTQLNEANVLSGITGIGDYAFANSYLIGIGIADSVTRIGDYAFSSNSFLGILQTYHDEDDTLIVSDNVTYLGEGAFYDCSSLVNVSLGSGITQINDHTFDGCEDLESVTMSSGVTTIGAYAFANCTSLGSITIPSSVTSISATAFDNCSSDLVIRCYANSAAVTFAQSNNISYVVIPPVLDNVNAGQCGDNVYWTFDSQTGTLTVSGVGIVSDHYTTNGLFRNNTSIIHAVIESGVTEMGSYMFEGCTNLESVSISGTVRSISRYAFFGCSSLDTISIPSGVTSIYPFAFCYCSSIESISIPNSVSYLGNNAFEGCTALETVSIGSGVTTLHEKTFYNCESLSDLTIANGLQKIENNAFKGCASLESLVLPDSVTEISEYALYNANLLKYLTIGANIRSYDWLVRNNNTTLVSVTVSPDNPYLCSDSYGAVYSAGKTYMCYYPVANTSTSFVMPDTVYQIHDNVFANRGQYLTSITLGDSFRDYKTGLFNGCRNLTEFVVSNNNERYSNDENGVLFNKDKSVLVLYPYGRTDTAYTIPNSVTRIEGYAFAGNECFTSMVIPDSVRILGEGCLQGCNSMRSVTIGTGVDTIPAYLFDGCKKLKDVTIPNSVTSIENCAFQNCSGLTSITIPDSVVSCGNDVFKNCNNLTIICNEGSYICQYAISHNINYAIIPDFDIGDLRIANGTASIDTNTITITANEGATQVNVYPTLKDGTPITFSNRTGSVGVSKNGTLYAKGYGTATATIDGVTANIIFDFNEETIDIENQLRVANAEISVSNKTVTLTPTQGATQMNVYPTLKDKSVITVTGTTGATGISKNGTIYARGNGTVSFTVKSIAYTIVFDFDERNIPIGDNIRYANATASVSGTTITLTPNQGASQISFYPTLNDGTALTFTNRTGGAKVSKNGTLYSKSNGTAQFTLNNVVYTVNFAFTQEEPVEPEEPEVATPSVLDYINVSYATKSIEGSTITLTARQGATQISLYPRMTDNRRIELHSVVSGSVRRSSSGTYYAKQNAHCTIMIGENIYDVYFVF